MTRDEIGDMIAALPQGLEPDELIFKLVNWAVDREREACAKVCEELIEHTKKLGNNDAMLTAISCAVAIRARGEK